MAIDRGSKLRGAAAMLAALGACLAALPAAGQDTPVGLRDSLPIGSNGLCEAQIQSPRPGEGLFDRRYLIVCRDAAAPVGSLHVFGDTEPGAALERLTSNGMQCRETTSESAPQGLPDASIYACTAPDTGLEHQLVIGQSGHRVYAARGLSVYRDALRLGLGSLATDRLVSGTIEVPLTQAGDPQAFARAQAEAISDEAALTEAYRRSNAGEFAEAAEFFSVSAQALQGQGATEATLNTALQQSNLGNFIEAAALFAEAAPAAESDPVLARLARNFQAIDSLNRGEASEAIELLDTPLPQASQSLEATLQLQIDDALAERLSAEQGNAIGGVGSDLTVLERAQLLDGQAQYVRAAALSQLGRTDAAEAALLEAQSELLAVRDGRVVSMSWLHAQVLAELAEIAERRGNVAQAETLHMDAVGMLEDYYPGSPALVSARALLAGLLARNGREGEAIALYRQLVDNADNKPAPALRRLLTPYFDILARQSDRSAAATDMFAASQLMLRPGLAQTQAVLARELSGGSDEASQLFRQSSNLTRAIEVLRAEVAQLEASDAEQQSASEQLAAQRERLEQLRQRQLEVQQQLAAYPRYRVVSDDRMDLAQLREILRDGEAYLKLVVLGDDAYAIYAEPGDAIAYRLSASPAEIGRMVDALRDSIAIEQAGQTITYPFEIGLARELYAHLLGPIDPNLVDIDHLIFEPDGAMLRLPINLLVTDDRSVNDYAARVADPAADPYDYRGTAWLGREMQVTTAVSPTAFRDVRSTRASNARAEYLGLGQNTPLTERVAQAATRSGGQMDARCNWAPVTWDNPIDAAELQAARNVLESNGSQAAIMTGDEFTDTRLRRMDELDEYRVLHFATHGLVTAPEPDCPPRPALLTSFGGEDSDGLLSFAEIFDLQIDADLVILSACNTASSGGLVALREAGLTVGGDFALDGLVRAFVGAGGRTVVASHWPVPDDYDATGRLISGFFETGQGTGTGEALRQAQLSLMDDAETSHPFYWSAFAIVGDGTIPVRR